MRKELRNRAVPNCYDPFYDPTLLRKSPVYYFAGDARPPLPDHAPLRDVDNRATLDELVCRFANDTGGRDGRTYWLAVVPGTSEVGGHHVAYASQPGDPPYVTISPEFRARLDHAYWLIKNDRVPYVLVSGGTVDPNHCGYNEAYGARAYLLGRYGAEFGADKLARRIVLDPWALHTECNVRNADRLAVLLDLDRVVVVTTARVGHWKDQGSYWTGGDVLAFDHRCKKLLGYGLGNMDTLTPDATWGPAVRPWGTRAWVHYNFTRVASQLLADPRWATTALEDRLQRPYTEQDVGG